jgi:hypothetical protein
MPGEAAARTNSKTEGVPVRHSGVYAVDLHSHSRFFHVGSGATAFDPVGARANAVAARVRRLDGFALTNHDYVYPAATSSVVIPGIEVSTTLGHVLVVGPDPPQRTAPGTLRPGEVVDLAHGRDCAAVLAHPYRNSRARDAGAVFDAVELNGKNPEHVARTRRLAERLDLPLVGGSDAHYPFELGRAYTRVDADELTPRTVADALRDGRVEPVLSLSRLDRTIDRVYSWFHSRKGWLDD